MTLGHKQRVFTLACARLIVEIYSRGYRATLGDAFRDPRSHGPIGEQKAYGKADSNHKRRLAIDLNLFDKESNYLTSTEDHRQFGEWWEVAYKDYEASWGGRFNDGNHYSFRHNGVR